ncbi:MAG: putative bifunctional diguanylate cyclase/phosphodiesterase [Clostridia bacterium]|jgi:diguanylate cyclase (GGDEF)-like protein/PAS domain S-box-containing protein
MQEILEIQNLLESLGSPAMVSRAEKPDEKTDSLAARAAHLQNGKAGDPQQAEPDLNESLFSQLFERIVQGYALRLEDDGEESSDSLEILLDGVPYSVLIMSTAGMIREANQAFFSTFGYAREELIDTPIYALLPEGYRAAFHERLARFSMRSDVPRQTIPDDILAFRAQRHDGGVVSMDCLLSSIQLKDEAAVIALIRDLSYDHTLFLQLNETKEHYVALSETITEAIFRLDDDFRIIFANTGVKNTFGWEREEVVGKPFSVLFPQEVFAKHEAEFRKYFFVDDQDRVANGMKRTLEFLGATKHRGVAPMEMSFGNSKDYKGRTLTCVIRDITQRKALERKLRHLAFHDKLTGLGNRDLFNEDMAGMLRKIQSDPAWYGSVMFLDLDGFKHINDTLGHDAGDELLVETGRRIRVCLRDLDVAYRFGGDEFVVVLASIKGIQDSIVVAERILASVSNPFILRGASKKSGKRVNVGVSIGVAVIPDHGRTLEEVTKSADIAMYCSKEAGRNRYTVYDPSIAAKATLRWQMEQEMKSALGSGGFRLLYQPLVGTDGRVRGMEALLRWNRLDGEVVSPGVFIPIAEENGLIVALGDWVLRRACYDAQRLSELGHPDIYVSVNVSNRQFDQPNYVDELENIVRSSGLIPSRLKLEITESTIMKNTDDAIERIKEIKLRLPGISFMVDDFGTGYSSLAYLSRLPVDFLKIDISFVMNLAELQNEKVVNAIINLGHSLDLGIVAEGIETEAQWAYFTERECSALQGYYFLRPSSLEEIHELIERGIGQTVPVGRIQL